MLTGLPFEGNVYPQELSPSDGQSPGCENFAVGQVGRECVLSRNSAPALLSTHSI